jgi:hypothetical protein
MKYKNTYQEDIAIIIISHNSKDITNKLCEKIINNTKISFDLCVVETGSNLNELSYYMTIYTSDGIRATRGFNLAIDYLKRMSKINNHDYKAYWCLMNDVLLPDNIDILNNLYTFMNKNIDCGIIHPFIENSPSKYLRKNENDYNKISFVEFISPLVNNKIIDKIFDDRFFYFWGVDYEIPKILHDNNFRIYISNQVGVIHNAGTTVRNGKDEDFKTMTEQFDKSRENMIKGLTEKYGERWYKVIYDNIPEDVSKNAYVDWIVNVGANCKMEDLI